MNLSDLRIFTRAAHSPSLGAAAEELHLTPSAVSKAIRRLEDDLGKPLFDRGARQLTLNGHGQLLLQRAQTLLALADQARSDVMGEQADVVCRIGGPAILLWRHGHALAQALRPYPAARLHLHAMFEDEALAALARGELDAAIVTDGVTAGQGAHWSAQWQTTALGSVTLQLAAGPTHPLVAAWPPGPVLHASTVEVLAHDFVCPSRSLFCGVLRGARADGWRDDQLPRKIRYWADDLQLLLALVRGGEALAYLPDFALAGEQLRRIHVTDCAYQCVEQVALVWNGEGGAAWLRELAVRLAAAVE
ncbi:LysR family transcriptional regulator [Rugamonas apoptosis]|uniref:LysR family transcriptional regulator n=1 Tax=Rugamonas apoptosis TaxID=2758570 RepID=A0A7W2FBA8_9BURK|nr:LysR family transcriptional regulator [Rugamonas apoptosis]MBA5688551.1 LysR family transcriptional regulator [Rugamonas apoptosis]